MLTATGCLALLGATGEDEATLTRRLVSVLIERSVPHGATPVLGELLALDVVGVGPAGVGRISRRVWRRGQHGQQLCLRSASAHPTRQTSYAPVPQFSLNSFVREIFSARRVAVAVAVSTQQLQQDTQDTRTRPRTGRWDRPGTQGTHTRTGRWHISGAGDVRCVHLGSCHGHGVLPLHVSMCSPR